MATVLASSTKTFLVAVHKGCVAFIYLIEQPISDSAQLEPRRLIVGSRKLLQSKMFHAKQRFKIKANKKKERFTHQYADKSK